MIVIATNVAETSITIPTVILLNLKKNINNLYKKMIKIRYVIDTGKFKKKITDPKIGL